MTRRTKQLDAAAVVTTAAALLSEVVYRVAMDESMLAHLPSWMLVVLGALVVTLRVGLQRRAIVSAVASSEPEPPTNPEP